MSKKSTPETSKRSIYLPADSLVRISPLPENVKGLKEAARLFGLSSPVSLGNLDHDTCSLRTSQGSLFTEQCEESSENFPSSGMWGYGECFEHRTSEPPTNVKGSLSSHGTWPTPIKNDAEKRGGRTKEQLMKLREKTGAGAMRLVQDVSFWRTPDAPGSGGPRNRQNSLEAGHQVTIAEQAEHWQTPGADSFRSRGGDRKDEMGLDQQARNFSTPTGRDHRTPNKKSRKQRGSNKSEQLPNFIHHFWEPITPDLEMDLENDTDDSLQDRTVSDGEKSSNDIPTLPHRLNPRFVEWLMGFPIGWSEV